MAEGEIILENEFVKTVFITGTPSYGQTFYARSSGGWNEVMEFATIDKTASGRTITSVSEVKQDGNEKYVEASGYVGAISFKMHVSLGQSDKWFKITVEDSVNPLSSAPLVDPMTSYLFKPEGKSYSDISPLDFTFTPQLKELPLKNLPLHLVLPSDTYSYMLSDVPQTISTVIGQHVFRAPAIVVQEKKNLAALIPDIDDLRTNYGEEPGNAFSDTMTNGASFVDPIVGYFAPAMDYDVTDQLANAPVLSYGWCAQSVYGQWHTYYTKLPSAQMPEFEAKAYTFYIYLDSDVQEGEGFEEIVRWQWEKYGKPYFESSVLPQAADYDSYAKYIFDYLAKNWVDFEVNGVQCGGFPINRESTPDFWFQGWFQHLRSAYGIYIYGQKLGNSTLVEKANKILNLALQSPNGEGPFYSIYSLANSAWYTDSISLGQGGTVGGVDWGHDYYHTLDNSWTGYWMLRWYEDLEKDARILPYTQKYADFLISHQQPSGAIPSWFKVGTLEPHPVFLESAETSASILFLAELGKLTGEQKYTDAAEKAADFMIKSVYPENKWFDYETFFSCSGKELDYYDDFTAQHPQNTLSIHWAAMGMRALYDVTENPLYLDYGCRALDYLCFYQQIWDAPFIAANTFGGFGVMNTDAEWNDARQSMFGQTLLDYYEITGNAEYFERGIAAMRSAFMTTTCYENEAVSPATYSRNVLGMGDENYAHNGYNCPSSGLWKYGTFDWGSGSAMAGAAEAWKKYGGVFIDADRGNAFGLDGCLVKEIRNESGGLRLKIVPALQNPYDITIVVKGKKISNVDVIVNDARLTGIENSEESSFSFDYLVGGEFDVTVKFTREGGNGLQVPGFNSILLIASFVLFLLLFGKKKVIE